MRCIQSDHIDPYFNLASEEYLLKQSNEDVFLLYRNAPSIVVGKHQNTLAEINLSFVKENEITVARRISGGGTVFHDLGNLNFAFITRERDGEMVNYKKYTLPIIDAMGKMGLDVKLGKRNELLLGTRKISGTASHVFKHRVLHHGTLLFSSQMQNLSAALEVQSKTFNDRSVKSIRSEVTNIKDHLKGDMTVGEFQNRILDHVLENIPSSNIYNYTTADLEKIETLRDTKFSTWEWNFGYSPRYQFIKSLSFGSGNIELQMNVEKGIIRAVSINGDFMSLNDIHVLEKHLVGAIHDPETLRLRLSDIEVSAYISGLGNEELLMGMF